MKVVIKKNKKMPSKIRGQGVVKTIINHKIKRLCIVENLISCVEKEYFILYSYLQTYWCFQYQSNTGGNFVQ